LTVAVCSLEDLLGVVACETNDKEVILEFTSWKDCHFLLKDRDDFLASVADVMGMEKGAEGDKKVSKIQYLLI